MPESLSIIVLTSDGSSNIRETGNAIRGSTGPLLLALNPGGLVLKEEDHYRFLRELKSLNADRELTIATKNKTTLRLAKRAGWKTIEKAKELQATLKGHPQLSDALRTFSPKLWREQIRTQLQTLGLLSLPKIRIWILFGTSGLVFLFIIFRLLPSATLHIWPSEETLSQTMNVMLVASGAQTAPAGRVKTLQLYPLTVRAHKTLTFDEIGKEFTGTNAEMKLTITNDAEEQFSLRKGTRFTNQAGMVFRLKRDVIIPSRSTAKSMAVADTEDQFGQILGERGNVPAGLKWEIPGLPQDERQLIYGRNETPAAGGMTSYRNVLRAADLEIAKKRLEQDLKLTAEQMVSEQRAEMSQQKGNLVELDYEELTRLSFVDMKLPQEFVGRPVSSVPVEGTVFYTVLLYDRNQLFDLVRDRLLESTGDQRILEENTVIPENLVIYVIDAPWDEPRIDWVKITADLSATQRYLLDPLTIVGARFGKQVRDAVSGKSIEEAERIVKNLPEVARVKISVWPFWNRKLPAISNNIHIKEER